MVPFLEDYEAKAQSFLSANGITFTAKYIDAACPKFCSKSEYGKGMLPCGGVHGGHYEITLKRARGHQLRFEFWNSYNDEYGPAEEVIVKRARCPGDIRYYTKIFRELSLDKRRCKPSGFYDSSFIPVATKEVLAKPPTAYSVLAGMALDANCPADFDDFCSEYGYDNDSRRAEASHKACTEHALKILQFFTTDELKALEEIS